MRKKQHRRINPRNREYDRFYVINYLVSPPRLRRDGSPRRLPAGASATASSSAKARCPRHVEQPLALGGGCAEHTEPLVSPAKASAREARVCARAPPFLLCLLPEARAPVLWSEYVWASGRAGAVLANFLKQNNLFTLPSFPGKNLPFPTHPTILLCQLIFNGNFIF